MALNKARIRVAQMARVYLAPVGTPAPADATVAMPTPWKEVGYFTPDSLQWATSPSFQEVKSHQSNYPTRRFQDADAATIQVDLQEWSADNFITVYGGGTVTAITGSPTQYKFSPPQIGARQQVAAVVEIIDGAIHFRKVIPCAEQSEGVSTTYERAKEANLPLRLAVMGSDLGDPWYDLTDDPAFAPAA
jgi:hypothetical protein